MPPYECACACVSECVCVFMYLCSFTHYRLTNIDGVFSPLSPSNSAKSFDKSSPRLTKNNSWNIFVPLKAVLQLDHSQVNKTCKRIKELLFFI